MCKGQRPANQEHAAGFGMVCTSGTHRSPAVARLALECLRRDGYTVKSPVHLSYGTWLQRKRCYWCASCKTDSSAKSQFFDRVHKWWKTIG